MPCATDIFGDSLFKGNSSDNLIHGLILIVHVYGSVLDPWYEVCQTSIGLRWCLLYGFYYWAGSHTKSHKEVGQSFSCCILSQYRDGTEHNLGNQFWSNRCLARIQERRQHGIQPPVLKFSTKLKSSEVNSEVMNFLLQ